MPRPATTPPTKVRSAQTWDVAIIGAGDAGLTIAAACLQAGRRVVLFERGTAAHRGNESLLAAARQAGQGSVPIWGSWRRKAADPLPAFATRGVEVVSASAHFIAPNCIEAAGRTYPFRRAVIAAGQTPVVPDLHGLASIPWLTPETLDTLEEAPEHLLVLGGGAEAVELAQAHAMLGCRVSLVQPAPNILPGEDLELVDPLRHHLRRDGVTLHENNAVLTVEHAGGGVAGALASPAALVDGDLGAPLSQAPGDRESGHAAADDGDARVAE